MTAKEIDGMLHKKHGSDPWVYFSQLREKTGSYAARTIDAFAMHVWPSSFQAIAYEIKVDRSDFLSELDDPQKRKPFVENSTEFYYVTPHGMVEPSEVPKETGLMWAQSGDKQARVVRKKAAPQEDIESFPKLFVASLLRKSAIAYKGEALFHLAGEDLTHEEMQHYVDRKAKSRVEDYQYQRKRKEEAKEELLEGKWSDYKEVYEWVQSHRRQLGVDGFPLNEQSLQQWWNELDEIESDAKQKVVRKIERAERKLETAKEKLLS